MKILTALLSLLILLTVAGCHKSGDIVISDAESESSPYTTTQPIITPADTQPETTAASLSTSPPDTATLTPSAEPAPETVPRPSGETRPPAELNPADLPKIEIIETAQALIGIPFVAGGSTPDEGFDNSGFIHYVLTQNGFKSTPRRASEQAEMGNKISSISELIPGDLVFFSTGGDRAEYGGIYIGGGNMIYSPRPGETVKDQNIQNDYWTGTFFVGVRVI